MFQPGQMIFKPLVRHLAGIRWRGTAPPDVMPDGTVPLRPSWRRRRPVGPPRWSEIGAVPGHS